MERTIFETIEKDPDKRAPEQRDEKRVRQYCDFFEEHFQETGRPKSAKGRKMYEKHRRDGWGWDDTPPPYMELGHDDKEELQYQVEVIRRRLRDANHALDQLELFVKRSVSPRRKHD